MLNLLCSDWINGSQAIIGLLGTFFLAFGLKSIREAGGFSTENPHPLSKRFWVGLILLSISAAPSITRPFFGGCPSEAQNFFLIDNAAYSWSQILANWAIVILTAALVVVTYIYALYTKRMVEEIKRQSRPYVYMTFERYERSMPYHYYRLLLRNGGNRVAQRITVHISEDAWIGCHRVQVAENEFKTDFIRVSSSEVCKSGVTSLVPNGEIEVGFYDKQSLRDSKGRQSLSYTVTYFDGAGIQYTESASLEYNV